jgi:hypothetical protein
MEFLDELELPKSWQDITVEEYIDLKSIDTKEFGFFGAQLEKFCILAAIDSDDDRIEDVEISVLNKYIAKLHFLNLEPSYQLKRKVGPYELIPFTKLTFGAYIDLDKWLQEPYDNFTKIVSVLYRRTKINEWGELEYEPYRYNINTRAEEFENYFIADVYAAYSEFIVFRNKIIETYKFLFDTDENGDLTEEEKEGLTEDDVKDINEYLKKLEEKKKFAWQDLAFNLASQDITKMRDVLELPIVMVLNNLAMMKVMGASE